MASMSSQRASSSSSSTPRWRYDAFLSFCGEDTRNGFTDHLYAALKLKGFDVFRDAEKLERGKYVSDELLQAIQGSMYAIVVISANYASSRWCLIELAEIVECMRGTNRRVLPVFYHVDPSDVRNQTGTFAEAFARHEKDPNVDGDKMQKWKAALKEVGNIAGWHVDDGPESIVVEEISREIFCGLSHNFSNVSKDLVGMEARMEEMESILGMGLDDVRFLGICGMGGIGKTTLAQVVYERIADKFEASCFIPNIREETKKHGLLHLQKQLISEILGESETNIQNFYVAANVIANRIRKRRVLIILDDVDGDEQVEALAGSHDWFGLGSRIIITSRDLHSLNRLVVDNTYEVEELNDTEALELFSWKAFKKPYPHENYVELSKGIVSYAQGLPLAIKVFGSMLFGRPMDAWKSAKDLLKENPNAEILDKLRISYDGLEYLQKQLFLDIAFFFHGADMDSIKHILESLDYYPNINIQVLVDQSLVTISNERLCMHDLLRKLGRKIVHSESPEEPGRRSRLWRAEDILHVMKENNGTDAVKGIVLKSPLRKRVRLNFGVFTKMKNLRTLHISNLDNLGNLEWDGDPSNFMLSNALRTMEWLGYPLESLPTNFQPVKLVEFKMRYSRIKQLWNGWMCFEELKHIDLSHSKFLIKTPDFSGIPNLENLELANCTNLSEVHPSIGFLRKLKWLDLQGCECLERLADDINLECLEYLNLSGCSRLNTLPNSVGNMTSLQFLYLNETAIKELPLSFTSLSSLVYLSISGCSRLEKIPNDLSGMECLECLYAHGTAIRELPSSIVFLKKLRVLVFGGKRGLDSVSLLIPKSFSGLSSLRTLDLSYCNLLDGSIPNDLGCLFSLRSLNLSGNKFTRIPHSVAQLSDLCQLELEDCSWLQALPKLPLGLHSTRVRNCPSLEFYKEMEMWRTSNEKLRSIDCSFVQAYIDYDGKPFKILHLHPRSPLWSKESSQCFGTVVACGPALLGYGIPKWFNSKSTNSFGTIQMHTDVDWDYGSYEWKGYALFIVYQCREPHTYSRRRRKLKVNEHGDSNSTIFDDSDPNFSHFVCQFQANEVDVTEPLVLCAPEVSSVGPSGFWVYIPAKWFGKERNNLVGRGSLKASITAGNLKVEVKKCGARVVRQHDASEFYQVLNSISPHGLDFQSYEKFFYLYDTLDLLVDGPIKQFKGNAETTLVACSCGSDVQSVLNLEGKKRKLL